MDIEKTNGYGFAISDLEGGWPDAFKSKLKKTSQKIIFKHLSFSQKIRLMYLFLNEKKKAANLDLSDLKAKGMTNTAFIKQQLTYLSMFSALSKVLDKEKAIEIMCSVMEETAAEAFSHSSPQHEAVIEYGNTFEFFRNYFRPLPKVCAKAGCLDMTLSEDSTNCFQLDIHWCVWFELAKKMNVPEACIPNCYADDYAYPAYFKKYGINYSRKGTIANGAKCCDLRFEKS